MVPSDLVGRNIKEKVNKVKKEAVGLTCLERTCRVAIRNHSGRRYVGTKL